MREVPGSWATQMRFQHQARCSDVSDDCSCTSTAIPETRSLLLLHGITDSGQCFPDLVARLGSSYRIVAPDALATAASDRFTAEELASEDPIEHMYAAVGSGARGRRVRRSSIGPLDGWRPWPAALAAGGRTWCVRSVARGPSLDRRIAVEATTRTREPSAGGVGAGRSAADPEGAIAQCRAENPTWPESEYRPWAQAKADVDATFLRAGIGDPAAPRGARSPPPSSRPRWSSPVTAR